MLSLSHWGMFDLPPPPIMVVPADLDWGGGDLLAPGAIIWMREPREVVYGRC